MKTEENKNQKSGMTFWETVGIMAIALPLSFFIGWVMFILPQSAFRYENVSAETLNSVETEISQEGLQVDSEKVVRVIVRLSILTTVALTLSLVLKIKIGLIEILGWTFGSVVAGLLMYFVF
jgi:hypothetical protein